jgi:hypothetical protein
MSEITDFARVHDPSFKGYFQRLWEHSFSPLGEMKRGLSALACIVTCKNFAFF